MIYLSTNWNCLSSVTQGTATVGTASTTILPAYADRTYAILINYGTLNVTIGIEAAAVLNKGIVIPANGGFYEMSGHYGNNCRGIITAIVDTTATVLNYMSAGGGV
jgi:hypothetical protein